MDSYEQDYERLFHLYKTNKFEYEKESRSVFNKLEKLGSKKDDSATYKYLIPYPDYNNENFNELIYKKKEFNIHKTGKTPDNCEKTFFELSPNQKFIANFLSPYTPYNGLLLFHSVGVGKTCTAISIAERYYEVYQKKILVILSSNIKDNFRKQIFDINKYDVKTNRSNMCTGTLYPDMIFNKDTELEKKVNKIINDRYEFIGYKEFVNKIAKIDEVKEKKGGTYFIERVRSLFSNRLIIVDEAHNLRMSNGDKQVAAILSRVLSATNNVKLLLMTATPMFNDASEILILLNLLLTNDKRNTIKINQNKMFDDKNKITAEFHKVLINNFRGYVSYMRGENPFTFPKRIYPSINSDTNIIKKFPKVDIIGNKIPKEKRMKNLEIVGSTMSRYQAEKYDQIGSNRVDTELDIADEEDIDVEDISNDMQNKIQISNIVYPSSTGKAVSNIKMSYGKSGFYECFNKISSGNGKNLKIAYKNDNVKNFLAPDKIGEFSPKIKAITKYISKSNGIVFVYSQYYYSGIIPLAIALEHLGFSKYNNSSILQGNNAKKNGLTYIILSTDSELSPNNDNEIKIAKADNNKNGEVIKVVIVSKIATEGIDFKRIREVHVMEPWYNLSRTEQIIGRAVRRCSHYDLDISERNVTIYLHANQGSDKDKESIDLRMYRLSENKLDRIKQVEKSLQENAIDCALNIKQLNFTKQFVSKMIPHFDLLTSQGTVIKDFVLGDEDADKRKCSFNTDKNNEGVIDESTFNKVFIVDDIELYKKFIAEIFSDKLSLSFPEIATLIKKEYKSIDEDVLAYTLDEMITWEYKFYNKEQEEGYLIYRADKYVFQNLSVKDKRLSMEERKYLGNIENRTLSKIKLTPLIEHEKNKKQTHNIKTNKAPNTGKKIYKGVVKEIESLTKELSEPLGSINEYNSYIIDYVIERLDTNDYLSLVSYISRNKDDSSNILSRLSETMSVFVEDDDIKYVFGTDNILYCFGDENELMECSPEDEVEAKSKNPQIRKRLASSETRTDNTVGILSLDTKTSQKNFKITLGKRKGTVCKSLETARIKEQINLLKKIKIDDKKTKKDTLCKILEILLRKEGYPIFCRSG